MSDTPMLDQIMANDEELRAKYRASAPATTMKVQRTLKEQDDYDRRLRYKPWTQTGERDRDLVTVWVQE